MSESVAEGVVEVPSSVPPEAPAIEEPTTDFAAQATEFKNRFAGSQRKLTEEMTARKAAETELETLRTWKAEQERASMTEVDRLKAEAEDARREAAAARSEAARAVLTSRFPQSFATLGDATPLDETVLTALEAKLAGAPEESEPEPRIDPNNPRKQPPGTPSDMDRANDWLMSTLDRNLAGI